MSTLLTIVILAVIAVWLFRRGGLFLPLVCMLMAGVVLVRSGGPVGAFAGTLTSAVVNAIGAFLGTLGQAL
jgi:hypothetical protein